MDVFCCQHLFIQRHPVRISLPKVLEVAPSRSRRNLIVSLTLGSLGQIDLIVTKEVSRFTRDLRQGGMIRFEPQGKNKHIRADELSKLSG